MSNTDKHEFSCIWKWIRCCNDVMNNVDCVIKRDFTRKKCIHVLKKSVGYQFFCFKNIRGISKKIYHMCYFMVIPKVER